MTDATSPMNNQQLARDAGIIDALRGIAAELAGLEVRRRDLYATRLMLWQRATAFGWTQARIAAASDCTTNAVTQALHRARRNHTQET